MKQRYKVLAGALVFAVVSCAVITVNIYFPEKDVKEAYKELEKELMTTEPKKEGQQPQQMPGTKPGSSLRFDFVAMAYAQEPGLSEKIADIIKKMPDVVNAYKERGSRMAETDRIRNEGAVGEGNDGMLVVREGTLSAADRKIVEMENANRRTVILGMTKAIIRLNRLQETPENIQQVKPQATAQFADLRRDSAKRGWWVQDPGGNWVRK
jgi:uncharacterized protein YdbL (DUF1318 family)